MAIGLDIGSKTIKVVELSEEKNGWKLKASGIAGYKGTPPDIASGEKELVPLVSTIKKLFKDARISRRDVVVSLPEPQVSTRAVKFPLLTESEVASAVKWEAEQYIPFPIEEAVVQHQIIEKRENSSPPEAVVLLVAATKALVEKYSRLTQMAGLNLTAVETDLLALTRSLAPKDQTVLIVDFGARSTNIAVSRKGYVSFSRSIPTAGEAFTRAIAQSFNIENLQAEEYKRNYGLSEGQLEGKVRKALDPVFRLIADEIKKAIRFYQNEEPNDPPKYVVLSGGSAAMPDVAPFLAHFLGLEVNVGNPFANVKVDQAAQNAIKGYAPFYSIAAGLAMRK